MGALCAGIICMLASSVAAGVNQTPPPSPRITGIYYDGCGIAIRMTVFTIDDRGKEFTRSSPHVLVKRSETATIQSNRCYFGKSAFAATEAAYQNWIVRVTPIANTSHGWLCRFESEHTNREKSDLRSRNVLLSPIDSNIGSNNI